MLYVIEGADIVTMDWSTPFESVNAWLDFKTYPPRGIGSAFYRPPPSTASLPF